MRNGRMRRIVELYEQGASKERVGASLRRWLGWAGVVIVGGIMVYGMCNSFRRQNGKRNVTV